MTDLDEVTVAEAIRTAHLPALLIALAHALDDPDILRDDLRPDPARIQEPGGGMTKEQRTRARELAVEKLAVLAERPLAAVPVPDEPTLRRMCSFLVGVPVTDDSFELLREELALPGEDRRAPTWHKDELDATRPFSVLVIGAGMSGLVAAHRLQQAGIAFTVLEKNPDVGGTWFENRYPGCRVDVPNHLYSYSFLQRAQWPQRFTPQAALVDYFRDAAERLGLRSHIRFETEVVAARFVDPVGPWEVDVRGPQGNETMRADVVISAVGQLNRPRLPDIPGRDTFAGDAFHSAQWDASVTLAGRRVAVIGTAASAIQLIPSIASDVAELHIYQRTPNWFAPTPGYLSDTPPGMQWLFTHVPTYSGWYRLSLFWRLAEGMLAAAPVDEQWPQGASVSATNDAFRQLLTAYLEAQFADAPELLARVVPTYPPLAKRILLDDGTWAATLKQPHVELVTDPIEAITTTGIRAGGVEREVDVIVYATGFRASEFLMPMHVVGRGGADLHERWGDDARAYLGLTIPDFPNLFCMYGPNTNLVANGSIIYFSECEVQYILSGIELLLERRAHALDCRQSVHDVYNAEVDAANGRMVWGSASVNSWYRNARGRVTQNWPFSLLEFWKRTRRLDPDDYELL